MEAAGCGVLGEAGAAAAFGGASAAGARARAVWVRRQGAVLSEALWVRAYTRPLLSST
jgi:hypothetical protein